MKKAWGSLLLLIALALPLPAGQDAAQPEGKEITLTGEVVDAACYMIHPQAATGPSHKQCAIGCASRGVPLAIINESDGKLYFPADGNRRLVPFIGQRVTATGTAADKKDPMELKMPVGENSMSVRVEGGYKVVTIKTLSKAKAKNKNLPSNRS